MILKRIKHYIRRTLKYIKNISYAKNTQKLLSTLNKHQKEDFIPFPKEGKIDWRADKAFYKYFHTYFHQFTLTKNTKEANYIYRW